MDWTSLEIKENGNGLWDAAEDVVEVIEGAEVR